MNFRDRISPSNPNPNTLPDLVQPSSRNGHRRPLSASGHSASRAASVNVSNTSWKALTQCLERCVDPSVKSQVELALYQAVASHKVVNQLLPFAHVK